MSTLAERQKTAKAIAEKRFISHVLKEKSVDLDKDIKQRMSSFSSAFWANRSFTISDNKLTYTTLLVHRFQDMKTRKTKDGFITKKRTQMHNRLIYGHLNNIIRELSFGFTEAIKQQFYNLEK